MKKVLFPFMFLGMISCYDYDDFKVNCLPANLRKGVIAMYPFIDGSLYDQSTNSNHIINPTTAVPSTDRNGNSNCAFQFDNSRSDKEFLTTTKTNFLNGLDKFSISIWYEPLNTTRGQGNYELLLGRANKVRCPDRSGEWSVGLFDCRRAVFGHNNSVWANIVTDFSNGCQGELVALTNRWHHIVATKNGNDYKIYFNGKLNDSASGNANCSNLQLAEDIGDMFIGSYYTGKIDDIIIYNRELSRKEVSQLFALAPCCL